MKVLAINGSSRRKGNTHLLLEKALEPARDAGFETETVSLADVNVLPCTACRKCAEKQGECILDDDFEPLYRKMVEADAILLGSPVYFGSASPQIKALMDRAGYVAYNSGSNPFQRKVGAGLVVARRAGVNFTLAQLLFWFSILGMVVPGSTYWPIAYGREKGEVESDEEGMRTALGLGRNIVWLLEKIKG